MWSTFALRTTVVLLLAVTVTACDSNEEDKEPTDMEMLVGTWAITGFSDDSGDRSEIIALGYEGVHLQFTDSGEGAFEIFPKHGPARRLTTTFTVDDEVNLISMVIDLPIDAALVLELTYIFDVQTERAQFHTTHPDALNTIFASDLAGDVRVVASKFGEDGMVQ